MADDDRLAQTKATVAQQHLGDARLGERLHGGNTRQLREDAERLRAEANLPDMGARPSFAAALHVYRERRGRQFARLFGRR
jgi:hypothetical protein